MLVYLFVPANNTPLNQSVWGAIGFFIAMVIFVGVVYLVNLTVITPRRHRKEAQIEFIREHASYARQFIGDSVKQKYLAILDTLEKMVNIENVTADNSLANIL